MLNSTISSGSMPGGIGPAVSFPPVGGTTPYIKLPACVSDSGHRFAVGMYHKDHACCERCGLIRKQAA